MQLLSEENTVANTLRLLFAVRDLEDCLGTHDIRTRSPFIPAKCREKEDFLAACIEGQQLAAEQRTASCPSKAKKEQQAQQAQAQKQE